MSILTLVQRNAQRWVFPALCVLILFLALSYGCGGGGGSGSIVLPPYATTGTITGSVVSSGDVVVNRYKLPGISRISGIAVGKSSAANRWAVYVSDAPSGNSGIWNAGYGTTHKILGNDGSSYAYFYHP